MCSINHDLKAIFIHVPKNAGSYIHNILDKVYDFRTDFFTRTDHKEFNHPASNDDHENISKKFGFVNTRNKGVLNYYMSSDDHNQKIQMTHNQWKTYRKLAIVRNPYDKFVSAFKFINRTQKDTYASLADMVQNEPLCNNWEYSHAFLTQYDHLVDSDGLFDVEFIGQFTNVDDILLSFLLDIRAGPIKHHEMIESNTVINKSRIDNGSFHHYFDQETLAWVNKHFQKDFETFHFKVCHTLEEIKDYNDIYTLEKERNYNNMRQRITDLKSADMVDLGGNPKAKRMIHSNSENALFIREIDIVQRKYDLPVDFFNTMIRKTLEKGKHKTMSPES